MVPAFTRERKSTLLPDASLHRNLSLYAIAAGAAGVQLLALAQPSEAEVIYTSAHVVIGRNQIYSIDLNHDGANDFTIINTFSHNGFSYVRCHLKVVPDRGGAVVHASSDYGAAALPQGESIGFGGGFKPTIQVMAAKSAESGSTVTYGGWFGAENKYLGLNFKIDGQIHYGWARLNVRWNHEYRLVATLTGYAYETDPGKPIITGDTGGAPDEASLVQPKGAVSPQERIPTAGATLAELSLGAPGLSIWRRPPNQPYNGR